MAILKRQSRSKGLNLVREVRKILEEKGFHVEGPGYGLAFYAGSMNPIHRDYWGIFDLMAMKHGIFSGHQVTTLTNKAEKVKAIQAFNAMGYVWAKVERKGFRIFLIEPETETEIDETFF